MKYYIIRKYEQSGDIIFKHEIAKEEYDPAYYEVGNMGTDGLPEQAVIDCHVKEIERKEK